MHRTWDAVICIPHDFIGFNGIRDFMQATRKVDREYFLDKCLLTY